MTNTDTITDHILDEINTRGYFLLSPDKWDNYGNTVDELVNIGIIESADRFLGNEYNSCYYYIEKDNPRKLGWSIDSTGYVSLIPY